MYRIRCRHSQFWICVHIVLELVKHLIQGQTHNIYRNLVITGGKMVIHDILTTYGIYHCQLTMIFFLQKKKKLWYSNTTFGFILIYEMSRLLVSFGIKIWKSRDFKIVGFFYIFLHIAQVFVSSINKWNPFLLILTIFQFWLSYVFP